jgi:hypothetical protein
MVILLPYPPIARNRSSGESAIESMYPVSWMRPTRVCVDVFQKATIQFVECAMSSPCCSMAMHEVGLLWSTGHSETADPVDASNCVIVLLDSTKRWLLDQRRPALSTSVTFTVMSTSKRPSLLFQT